MIRNDAHGDGGFPGVLLPGHFGQFLQQRHEDIRVVIRPLALQHRDDPFKAHPGIHVLGREFLQRAVAAPVVLDEDEIPEFDHIGRPSVDELRPAPFLGPVDMDLRARAAGASLAHFPEVVLLVEAENMRGVDVRDLLPDSLRLIILPEHRHPQAVLRQLPDRRHQLPRP